MKNKYRLTIVVAATISFLLSTFAFVFYQSWLTEAWLKLQIAPNVTKIFASFENLNIAGFSTVDAAVKNLSLALAQGVGIAICILFALLLLTFCCGRFYCSVLCPLGILQDIIDFVVFRVRTKKNRQSKIRSKLSCSVSSNFKKTRYSILAISLAVLLGGWVFVFEYLDPYSNFGRIVVNGANFVGVLDSGISWTGVWFLLALIVLVTWKQRIFCTAICPVGTLLGLCARNGKFGLSINDKCKKCSKCVAVCPAECINLTAKTIDNERCVRCLKCVSACPVQQIGFAKKFAKTSQNETKSETEPTRRNFVFVGMMTAVSFFVG
jgi:polyferredoxin